jgi:Flp pilus assembly protein TadG
MRLVARARRHGERDAGAVAVIVAICTIVLFGVAAMAVDLGNGWSRKRSAQTDADFAALAGAAQLPDANAARAAAYDYLKRNLPKSDNQADAGPLTNYDDNDLGNGEIDITASNKRITVWVPKRRVNFGIAAAIGFTAVNVQATATAEIRSPKRLLPFFLNSTCNLGPETLKDASTDKPTFYPADSPKNKNQPVIDTVTPALIDSSTGGTLTLTGKKFDTSLTVALIHAGAPAVMASVLTVTPPTAATVAVPAGLASGTWYVQANTVAGGWSADTEASAPSFSVTASGCGSSDEGDFGMLYSPRNPPPDPMTPTLAENMDLSQGIDHGIECFPGVVMPANSSCPGGGTDLLPPPVDKSCEPASAPLPGAILDDDPTRDDANCMNIQNGISVGDTTAGLITGDTGGGSAFVGRLTDVANADSSCHPPGQSNPTSVTINPSSYTINNDVLSCYLNPGHTLAELKSPNPASGILSDDIFNSPRMFFVPVLNSPFNPANGFYPVTDFRGVFITDESENTPASTNNGIYFTNSGQKISQITVFAFSIKALPDTAGNDGGTVPFMGAGPKIPVLIN